MNRWTVLLATILFAAFVAVGCSGGGDSPVLPGPGTDMTANVAQTPSGSTTYLWGYYDVTIDLDTQNITAVPNRSSLFAANVVEFLNSNPAAMIFTMNDLVIGTTEIIVDIDVGIKHPFDGMPQFNGYDVRGVFMGDGSETMSYNSDLDYPVYGTDQFHLDDPVDMDGGGPDGYTRWYNASEFPTPGIFGYTHGNMATKSFTPSATLSPYKYYADGIDIEDDVFEFLTANEADRGVFSTGSVNTRNYYLEFPLPTPAASYGYAIVANWEDPAIHPSNAPEAVAINVTVDPDIWYVDNTNNGGDLKLEIDVWNWDFQPTSIIIESTVLNTPYTFDSGDMTPTGGAANWSTYEVEIPTDNVTGLLGNEFWVICEAGNFDYTCDFTLPGDGSTDTLAACFRNDLYVHDEMYCTDPIVTDMNPNVGNIYASATDVEINGDLMEDGPELAAFLTNGTIDIDGTNVTWVSINQCTADFDYAGAGATEGFYDLYFTDGDGCEVVLVDAMELTEFWSETFDSSPADWTYAYYQYWPGCTNSTVGFSTAAPFGPSGSGSLRFPASGGNNCPGGCLQTVVTPPFFVPSGFTDLRLRIYACEGFGGSYSGYMGSNWKIVQSSTPGLDPFLSGANATLPAGGAYLQNDITEGSSGWGVYIANHCNSGPLRTQPGWRGDHGGGDFPGSLSQYVDLIIPSSMFGANCKVAFQWHPDWCGWIGNQSGFALDDYELWAP